MIALQITDIKSFTSQSLNSTSFDTFFLVEAFITTYQTIHIDGHIVPAYFEQTTSSEEPSASLSEFSLWKDSRPFCFDLIKGKHTPVNFRFTLQASNSYLQKLLQKEDPDFDSTPIKGLILNIKYDQNQLFCITSVAYHSFIADKTLDKIWDKAIKKSLDMLGLSYEEK